MYAGPPPTATAVATKLPIPCRDELLRIPRMRPLLSPPARPPPPDSRARHAARSGRRPPRPPSPLPAASRKAAPHGRLPRPLPDVPHEAGALKVDEREGDCRLRQPSRRRAAGARPDRAAEFARIPRCSFITRITLVVLCRVSLDPGIDRLELQYAAQRRLADPTRVSITARAKSAKTWKRQRRRGPPPLGAAPAPSPASPCGEAARPGQLPPSGRSVRRARGRSPTGPVRPRRSTRTTSVPEAGGPPGRRDARGWLSPGRAGADVDRSRVRFAGAEWVAPVLESLPLGGVAGAHDAGTRRPRDDRETRRSHPSFCLGSLDDSALQPALRRTSYIHRGRLASRESRPRCGRDRPHFPHRWRRQFLCPRSSAPLPVSAAVSPGLLSSQPPLDESAGCCRRPTCCRVIGRRLHSTSRRRNSRRSRSPGDGRPFQCGRRSTRHGHPRTSGGDECGDRTR